MEFWGGTGAAGGTPLGNPARGFRKRPSWRDGLTTPHFSDTPSVVTLPAAGFGSLPEGRQEPAE